MVVLLLVFAAGAAASSTFHERGALGSGGWVSWRVLADESYVLSLSVSGQLSAGGTVGIGFATGSSRGSVDHVYTRAIGSRGPIDLDFGSEAVPERTHVTTASSPDIVGDQIALSCVECPPGEVILVGFVAGDITDVQFFFEGEGLEILGFASGNEAWHFSEADLAGPAASEVTLGPIAAQGALFGSNTVHASRPIIGLHWPGALSLDAQMHTPSSSEMCPCWPNGTDPPGAYSFTLAKAGPAPAITLAAAPDLFAPGE